MNRLQFSTTNYVEVQVFIHAPEGSVVTLLNLQSSHENILGICRCAKCSQKKHSKERYTFSTNLNLKLKFMENPRYAYSFEGLLCLSSTPERGFCRSISIILFWALFAQKTAFIEISIKALNRIFFYHSIISIIK